MSTSIQLCDVCGEEETPTMPLVPRQGLQVCPDCETHERRYNPETGFMIERRRGYWVNITKTFVAPRYRALRAREAKGERP
jgi:hypothetical protein